MSAQIGVFQAFTRMLGTVYVRINKDRNVMENFKAGKYMRKGFLSVIDTCGSEEKARIHPIGVEPITVKFLVQVLQGPVLTSGGDMTALVDVSLRLKSEDFIISREIIIRGRRYTL